jgi:hypothetical protein
MAKTLAGVLAVSVAALLFAGCGGGSSPSEVAVDAVSASDSTTTTTAETVPPSTEPVALEVPTTPAPPVTRSTQPSQTVPAIPPPPTTTICVPNQSQISKLNVDWENQLATGAVNSLKIIFGPDSYVPAFGIENSRVERANRAERDRALAELQSCKPTTWSFQRYPRESDYRMTPTTLWGWN